MKGNPDQNTLADNKVKLERRTLLKISVVFLLVFLLVCAAGSLMEKLVSERKQQNLRASVINNLATIRAKLEGMVSGNLMLVRGLQGEIVQNPDITQREFEEFAHYLMGEKSQLRNIGGAPGMVISLMYPLQGNEAAIGLDYRKNPKQREAALRAINTGETVIAGPVNLLQGGQGFIARLPVYLPPVDQSSERRVWGVVSAVIDVAQIYQQAGLTDKSLPVTIAIRGKDGLGESGEIFYGDGALFESPKSVMMKVTLPGGNWQIAAMPKEGWVVDGNHKQWMFAGTLLFALVLAFLSSLLMSNYEKRKVIERLLRLHQEHLEVLVAQKTADLEKSRESSEMANLAKSTFLANMSHELRTPMHAILSFSSMGVKNSDEKSSGKLHKYFSNIEKSAERLMLLLNDLLDLAKMESGRMELDRHMYDLKCVIDICIGEFQELANLKLLSLNVEKRELDLVIPFDQNKILQVVRNLVSNAIKFSPENSSITIAFDKGEIETLDDNGDCKMIDAVEFSVSDEGDGIPEDELEGVFDKFVQSSKTRSGAGGTGLGLAICKEIVERHGGRISAGNSPQGGAVFTVVLPKTD